MENVSSHHGILTEASHPLQGGSRISTVQHQHDRDPGKVFKKSSLFLCSFVDVSSFDEGEIFELDM
jgi:hypothetical protein